MCCRSTREISRPQPSCRRSTNNSAGFLFPRARKLFYARLMIRVPGWLLIAVFALCVAGCTETAQPQNDEQNPHFQRAHDLINLQDYKSAIGEFDKVLEANPHSAATHYELGWICENDKIRDYAAAIYHYQ